MFFFSIQPSGPKHRSFKKTGPRLGKEDMVVPGAADERERQQPLREEPPVG